MRRIRLGQEAALQIAPDCPARAAAEAMVASRVGAAAVVRDGRVIGVVTERDMLQKVVAGRRDPESTPVSEVMTSPVLSVPPDATVEQAANLMRRHHFRHLVVLDEQGRLVGMLALRYLLYELMDDVSGKVDDLVGYIMSDGPGG